MNKRIIASLLAGCFAAAVPASMMNALAALPAEIQGTRYEEAVSVLSSLYIMNGDDTGEYRLDDTIIRSEVAKMAVAAMGLTDVAEAAKGYNDYDDVPQDHWANGFIHVATSLGIIEGDGDGKFRPNDKITYREAVAIMVRAAGYAPSAANKGGYPSGYITVANENKMTKNVQGKAEDEISRGNVAILTYNTLETYKMEQVSYGSNVRYEVTDKTLLSDNLETDKITGQITATGETALSGYDSVTDGRIRIDKNDYLLSYPASNLLGYNVTAYAKKTKSGEREIILAMPLSEKNKTLNISNSLFSKLTTKNSNNAIEYYIDEKSSKVSTAVISADAQLIYNNKSTDFSLDLINIADKSAYMTLLDTDNNSEYDIVFVTEYKNHVVDHVSNEKIVGKDGTSLRLEDVDYTIYNGLNELKISDLKEWDVLSVITSLDKKLAEIQVVRNVVSGKVNAIGSDGYTIGDKLYKKAVGCEDAITLGLNAEFCLDINGDIAAVKSASTVTDSYAYLTNAYATESGDNVMIKITDKNGDSAALKLADKIRFNGTTTTDDEVLKKLTGAENRQLITYSKNSSGIVTEINTADDNSESGTPNTDKFTLNAVLTDSVYQTSTSKLDNVRITDKTIVFDVSDINNIRISDKTVFENNQKYSGYVYDLSESYEASVVVLTDTAFKPNANSSIAVVKSIADGKDSEDNEVDILTALVDGKETVIYAVDNETLVKDDGKKLAAGDIIQYKTDSDNKIAGIRVLFDASENETEFTAEPEGDLVTVYGKVTKKFTDSVNVTVNGGSTVNYKVSSDVNVYSVDTTKSKNNIVKADFADVSAYDEDENNRLFIRIYEDEVKELVIVK